MTWWREFFDEAYLRLWAPFLPGERSDAEADGLWQLLGLAEGSRVLDAPCGQGRLTRRLAARGAALLGVDQSEALLAAAEAERGDLPVDRLRYLHADLRQPLGESGFDAAFCVFSSLGYGTEDDDLAILATLRAAVRPGGRVLVETMHRDVVVARRARGAGPPAFRLPDGTIMVEEPRFDALTGRVETAWHWAGPGGAGSKRAWFRAYSPTELVRLLERAGLVVRAAVSGCTPAPFEAAGPDAGGRLGLLAEPA